MIRAIAIAAITIIGSAELAPRPLAVTPIGEQDSAAPLEITVPGSSPLDPADPQFARRGLSGQQASRSWFSFVQGGTRYTPSIEGAGSRCNPVPFEPALAGSTHVFVDIGDVEIDSDGVATAIVAALDGAGVVGATVIPASGETQARVSIPSGSGFLAGGEGDPDGQHGIVGCRQVLSSHAFFGLTGSSWTIYEVDATRWPNGILINAVGARGDDGYQPLLAVGLCGPRASVGTVTQLRGGRVAAALQDGRAGTVAVESLFVAAGDFFAVCEISDGTGLRMYAPHAGTPSARFNETLDQNNLYDAALDDPTVSLDTAFGVDREYEPSESVPDGFELYGGCFVVVEDATAGAARRDGVMPDLLIGSNTRNPLDGSPTELAPAFSSGGGDFFHWPAPQVENIAIVSAELTYADVSATDNECAPQAVYTQEDDLVPTLTPGPLLGSTVVIATTANSRALAEFDEPIPVGVADIGADRYLVTGGTSATISPPGAITEQEFCFDPPGTPADYLTTLMAGEDPRVFHDFLDCRQGTTAGQCVYDGATSDMPFDDPDPTWPDPYEPDAADTTFGNAGRGRWRIVSTQTGYSTAA